MTTPGAAADPRQLNPHHGEVGRDPEVRAGWFPPGAVAALLQDRAGAWHEARAGDRAWLCVLPQRSGQGDPPIVYRDVEDIAFDRVVDAEGLPALWPKQAPARGRLHQTGDGILGYRADDWYLWVEDHAGFELDTVFRPIPGTILGNPHGFGLENLRDGRWRAVAVCASFTIDIQAGGDPPERLDLVAIDQVL
jgi:hypothetical protein